MTGKHWPPLSNNRCDISPMMWTALNSFRQTGNIWHFIQNNPGSLEDASRGSSALFHSGNQREKENEEEEEENNPMKGKIDKCVRIHTFIYTRERNMPSKGNI